MDHSDVERLRDRHPAWRLLRAANAPLILAFLGRYFVESNHGATSMPRIWPRRWTTSSMRLTQLTRVPRGIRSQRPTIWTTGPIPMQAGCAAFYPLGSDEVHYDATPAFEKAYGWVIGLGVRPFVGTESRLHTVVELLRQIVHGTETDPELRLAELQRRRDEIDHGDSRRSRRAANRSQRHRAA